MAASVWRSGHGEYKLETVSGWGDEPHHTNQDQVWIFGEYRIVMLRPVATACSERLIVLGAGSGSPSDNDDGRTGTAIITKTKPRTKRPNLYRVLLLNDDYTPMEFVVHVLERFFNKSREDATRIMLLVHHNGVGECGVYTYEIAETKVTQVMDFARKHQHPLQCVMEKK